MSLQTLEDIVKTQSYFGITFMRMITAQERFIFVIGIIEQKNKTLFNLTGHIEIDLILIEIIYNSLEKEKIQLALKYKLPKEFFNVQKFFDYEYVFKDDVIFNFEEALESLEYLLWKWKTPLGRELYPFLFSLNKTYYYQKKI